MPSSHLKNFLTQAVQRLLARVIGSIASDCEADAAISEAEYLDRIEEAARRYEAENKPQLAKRLRQRALSMTGVDAQPMQVELLDSNEPPKALPSAPRRSRSKRGEDA